jgi:hypothetical protein
LKIPISKNKDYANESNNIKRIRCRLKRRKRIEIEGDLKKKVVRIKATGKVAWVVAFGAITVAVISALTVNPAGEAIAITTGGAAVTVLGGVTATAAIVIAVSADSAKVLTSLRDNYTIVSKERQYGEGDRRHG